MRSLRLIVVSAITGSLLLSTLPASSETIMLAAHLTGASELPTNASGASGDARFSYDTSTRQLQFFLTYEGLSAIEVDVHGPASQTSSAPVVVRFPVAESPLSGTTSLSAGTAADLLEGRLYIDIHTMAYPAGEIRGQIGRR